jgi:hypothetical protein
MGTTYVEMHRKHIMLNYMCFGALISSYIGFGPVVPHQLDIDAEVGDRNLLG